MSRKYSQRGYQEAGEREAGERNKQSGNAPRQKRDGPGGRGLGAPDHSVFRCAQCGQDLGLKTAIEWSSSCPHCEAALHSCTHCRFFDSGAPAQCRVPGIARVASKAKANQCGEFERKVAQETDGGSDPDDPKSAFDALFDF